MKRTLSLIGIICQIALQVHADPTITTEPTNVITYVLGINATFSVVATGTPTLKYQWKKGSAGISGATNSSLVISNVAGSDAAGYSVRVYNSVGTNFSDVAWLRTPPDITTQPQNKTNGCDTTATFSVSVGGSVSLDRKWYLNNNALAGQTNGTCVVSNVQPVLNGDEYFVTITNDYGAVTSSIAKLYVKATILVEPVSATLCVGTTNTFEVTACGFTNLSYQWRRTGINIAGATGSSFSTNTTTASAGNYTVVVSNAYGTDTSVMATLTAVTNSPSITIQPSNQTVTVGNLAQFGVTATGHLVTYQWFKDGTAVPSATNATPAIVSVQESDAATYYVTVSNACGVATSSNAVLTVNTAACVALPDGLIAWWQAESNANDFTNAYNGTWVGNASYATGKVGQAFQFPAYNATNAISFGTNVGNFGTNDFTIEFWILSTFVTGGRETIIEKRVCDTDSYFEIGNAGGGLVLYLQNSGSYWSYYSGLITDGIFHHVAFARQDTNVYNYVDGTLRAIGWFPLVPFSNSANFMVGQSCVVGQHNFSGLLDEIGIYDRALSTEQIKAIYDASSAGKCTEP